MSVIWSQKIGTVRTIPGCSPASYTFRLFCWMMIRIIFLFEISGTHHFPLQDNETFWLGSPIVYLFFNQMILFTFFANLRFYKSNDAQGSCVLYSSQMRINFSILKRANDPPTWRLSDLSKLSCWHLTKCCFIKFLVMIAGHTLLTQKNKWHVKNKFMWRNLESYL